MTLAQRLAYVTGGMGGIGTAICQRLHKEGSRCRRLRPDARPQKWVRAESRRLHLLHVRRQRRGLGFDLADSRRSRPSMGRSMCW